MKNRGFKLDPTSDSSGKRQSLAATTTAAAAAALEMNETQGYPFNAEGMAYPSRYYHHREDYLAHHRAGSGGGAGSAGVMNQHVVGMDAGPCYDPSRMGSYPETGGNPPYGYSPSPYDPVDGRFNFPAYHPASGGPVPGPGGNPRGHSDMAVINHRVGASYGHPLPWYGGSPRAYPIPPEHMYNMYHFGR